MDYRIKEEKFDDGRSDFYPQYMGKVKVQRRNGTGMSYFEIDGWVNLSDSIKVATLDDAKVIIDAHKISMIKKNAKLIEEIIHEI